MPSLLALPARLLALIGRYGTEGFLLSIFLGLALPQFAAAARPFLAITIFVFVTLTFARADLASVTAILRRPLKLILVLLWLVLAPVLIVFAMLHFAGRDAVDPGLLLGIALLAAAPPIMSGPAVAMLLGLEPTLLLVATLATTALAPLLSPLLAEFIAGAAVPIDRGVLMLRLLWLVGGAILAAIALRLVFGEAKIRAAKREVDGIGVIMYFVFAVAAMDGVTGAFLTGPARVLLFLAAAFTLTLQGFLLGAAVLRFVGPGERLVFGYGTGQRNMGLLIAALGAGAPETTFLFFSLAQFPIYIMPQVMKWLGPRLLRDT